VTVVSRTILDGIVLSIVASLLIGVTLRLNPLDWLLFCTITPGFVVIPGSEGMEEYKDYWFHFRGFLKGTIFSIAAGLVIAAIVMLL